MRLEALALLQDENALVNLPAGEPARLERNPPLREPAASPLAPDEPHAARLDLQAAGCVVHATQAPDERKGGVWPPIGLETDPDLQPSLALPDLPDREHARDNGAPRRDRVTGIEVQPENAHANGRIGSLPSQASDCA